MINCPICDLPWLTEPVHYLGFAAYFCSNKNYCGFSFFKALNCLSKPFPQGQLYWLIGIQECLLIDPQKRENKTSLPWLDFSVTSDDLTFALTFS